MASNAVVSVVIPTYNCAPFLKNAIDSVLSQTYTNFEVIVVDDGSTDNTAEVLGPYATTVKILTQPNRGLAAARNAGIHAASGTFIALLDADDFWVAEKLERQLPYFENPRVGIVTSDFSVRYSDGTQKSSYLSERPLAAEGFVFENYIQSRFLFPSAMVLRRECLDECGFFDEEMLACEDVELFARICLRWEVALIRKPLMIRYEGTHNITANSARLNRYMILALEKLLAKEPDITPHARSVVRKELAQQYFWHGYAAFHDENLSDSRRSLRNAMATNPEYIRAALPMLAASYSPAFLRTWLKSVRKAA